MQSASNVQRLSVQHIYCKSIVQSVQSATELYLHFYTEAAAKCSAAQKERKSQSDVFLSGMQSVI
jgi:hypothetical protein